MRLLQYINESIKKVPWSDPKIGWWLDKDVITLYHGSHIKNIDFIKKNGILPAQEGYTEGRIYLAFEPYTARGYSSMAGQGGESKFRDA